MNKEEYFNSILNRRYGRGLCHTCGNYQSHKLRWCKVCGSEFCSHEHTLIEAARVAKNIGFEKGIHARHLRPAYVSAIYKLRLKSMGYTSKEFEAHLTTALTPTSGAAKPANH